MGLDGFYSKVENIGKLKRKEVLLPDLHWLKLQQYMAYLHDIKGIKTTMDRLISEILMHHFNFDQDFITFASDKPPGKKAKPPKI